MRTELIEIRIQRLSKQHTLYRLRSVCLLSRRGKGNIVNLDDLLGLPYAIPAAGPMESAVVRRLLFPLTESGCAASPC